ncbi:hypothetical protein DM02DRAFT_731625 [Periconia macrospinosa]|uniref:DUF7708 domain-containing protein n=1 Tax=Periconia macrospinosa TaxID=97972 RepID=A0A2V1DCB3_9PLEO|nr:hypothetical protein DM02DRAFT_731625 [Periconia macrospinosa]
MELVTGTSPSVSLTLLGAGLQRVNSPQNSQLAIQNLQRWYTSEDSIRADDPAREAYEEAIQVLKRELTSDDCKRILVDKTHTIGDVQLAIQEAQANYENSHRRSSAREWLRRCASRIVHYGNVMDVMIQGCPEYASFAWGALKFLFIVITNHEELLTEFSKAVAKIGDALPRVELLYILYPTARMKTGLSELYAKIIQFVQLAIKYYKSGRLSKSLAAVTKPFSLKYKPVLDDIRECSRRIDELANIAHKAEFRDLHLEVKQLKEIALGTYSLQQQSQRQFQADLEIQRGNYQRAQIELITSLPIFSTLPSQEATLKYCQSIASRRRQRISCTLSYRDLLILKTWFETNDSSVLIGQAHGIKTSSRDFAVDLLNLLIPRSIPAIWILPENESMEIMPDLENIMASLVAQTLELNPAAFSAGQHPISTHSFRRPISIKRWFDILQKCMEGLKYLLLVLDFTMLQSCLERSRLLEAEEFLEAMLKLRGPKGPVLKIVALTWKMNPIIDIGEDSNLATELVSTDPGPKKVRLMRNPKFRAAFSARRQRLAVAMKESKLVVE